MAFERNKLAKIGGGTGDSNAVYIYSSTEAVATTKGANYFNDAADELNVGDVIFLIDTDTVTDDTQVLTTVKSISAAGVVALGEGVTIGDAA